MGVSTQTKRATVGGYNGNYSKKLLTDMQNRGIMNLRSKKSLTFYENSGIINNMNGQNNNYDFFQKTLHDIEEKKRVLNYEVGTLISPDGKVIKEYGGEAHSIHIPETDKPIFEGNIFTHNHPGGRTFTQEDILEFADSGAIEIRVSTPQGTYFSLKERSEDVNRSIGRVMQEEKIGDYAKSTNMILQQMEDNNINMSIIEQKSKIYDIMGDDIHKWLMENATEFGYIYKKGDI